MRKAVTPQAKKSRFYVLNYLEYSPDWILYSVWRNGREVYITVFIILQLLYSAMAEDINFCERILSNGDETTGSSECFAQLSEWKFISSTMD